MSEWITDREPTEADGNPYVWVTTEHGVVLRKQWDQVCRPRPWQPIVPPEPYVKAKRYEVRRLLINADHFFIWDLKEDNYATSLFHTREAAERIAAIYEEVMP